MSKGWTYGGGSRQPLFSTCLASGVNDPTRRGENPYTFSLTHWTRSMYYQFSQGVPVYGTPAYVLWGVCGSVRAWNANDELQLLSDLASTIRGHDFNGAVFAAELKESLSTVESSSLALARLFKAVCRRDWRAVLRYLAALPGQFDEAKIVRMLKSKDVAGAWMSIQYGWKPLLQDIFEAMKAIEMMTKDGQKCIYRTQRSIRQQWDDRASPAYNPLPASGTRTVRYKVVFKERLSAARKLGLLDPASVLWEKLPWSFVIDWFVPVGNYLGCLSFLGPLNLTYVRSEFAKSVAHGTTALPSDPKIGWLSTGGAWHSERVTFTRTIGTSINVPLPTLNAMERAFSTSHLKNAAALVYQVGYSLAVSVKRARDNPTYTE